MAVSRFTNLPEYTPFDIYVPTSADMEAKVRQLEVNDLMAKKAIDDDLHNKLGETGQLFSKFKPNQFFNVQHESGDVTPTASRLYPAYQAKIQEFYNKQQELLDKHSDNLSTPEAQRDFQKFQGYTNSVLSELADIKASDEALTKSEEARAKAIAENTGGNIDGFFNQYNTQLERHYGLNSPMSNIYNKSVILPSKAIDRNKHITDYVGDKLVTKLKSERLIDPSITTISQLIPAIREGKISNEARTRIPQLLVGGKYKDPITGKTIEARGLMKDWVDEYKPMIIDHAQQRVRDTGVSYDEAYKSVENEVRNDFLQNVIGDYSQGIDANTKLLSDEQAKGSGKGIYDMMNGLTSMENFVMDNKNKPTLIPTDDKGNLYSNFQKKLTIGSAITKNKMSFNTPDEYFNYLSSKGAVVTDEFKNEAIKVFSGEKTPSILSNILNDRGTFARTVELPQLYNEAGKPINIEAPTVDEGNKLDFSSSQGLRKSVDNNPILKNILINQGIDLNKLNKQAIESAVKRDKEATDKLVKVTTQGVVAESLNSDILNKNLNDALISSTVRTGSKETLDDNLKDLINTKDLSIDGQSFKNYLNSGGKVNIRTNDIVTGSGQNKTAISLRRTAEIKDKEGNIIKTIPFLQDISNPAINNNKSYKALNTLNEKITSGERLDDEFNGGINLGNGFKAQLYKTYDPVKKEYVITGDVYDPTIGREIPYEIFTQEVAKQAIRDVVKSTSIQGGKESEKQQENLFKR